MPGFLQLGWPPTDMTSRFCVLATETSLEDRGGPRPRPRSVWNDGPKGSCRERQGAGQGGRPASRAEKETHRFYAHD